MALTVEVIREGQDQRRWSLLVWDEVTGVLILATVIRDEEEDETATIYAT